MTGNDPVDLVAPRPVRPWPGERSPAIARTAFVATYPPRRCGIATFTHDLATSTGNREIVALHPPDQTGPYPIEVHHRIRRDEPLDYARTARSVSDCVDIVSIQHEDGIWGGPDGDGVLDFVHALRVPATATLHSVLRSPTPGRRAVLAELVSSVEATVVMSRSAATLLTTAYGVDARRLEIIPHGVPDLPLVDPETVKPSLDLAGRSVILSFGLLGPGKGYELAIDALPDVVAAHPDVVYVIVGASHPDVIRREGEAYRNGLVARARAHGLGDHVRFVDRFVGRVELTRWLEAADVFVTPYSDLDKVVSGTLSYAMSAGRATVSTPFAYASELLADGRGLLVPPGSPALFGRALNDVLEDRELRLAMGRRAHEHSRRMVWSSVGADYGRLIARIAGDRREATRIPNLAAVRA